MVDTLQTISSITRLTGSPISLAFSSHVSKYQYNVFNINIRFNRNFNALAISYGKSTYPPVRFMDLTCMYTGTTECECPQDATHVSRTGSPSHFIKW